MLLSFCFNNGDTEEYKGVDKMTDRRDRVMSYDLCFTSLP